ncbi:MAG: hypothetical protein ACE5NG_01565 [bacterium]
MKKKIFKGEREKQEILLNRYYILNRGRPVAFAFTHGSFPTVRGFNDVDPAIFVDGGKIVAKNDIFGYERNLWARTNLAISGYTVDLRVQHALIFDSKWVIPGLFCCAKMKQSGFLLSARPGICFSILSHIVIRFTRSWCRERNERKRSIDRFSFRIRPGSAET